MKQEDQEELYRLLKLICESDETRALGSYSTRNLHTLLLHLSDATKQVSRELDQRHAEIARRGMLA